LRNFFNNKS